MPAQTITGDNYMQNIIFCGVGGQGVILASKIVMETAKRKGYDVKESEVHGMAQRGGSVNCNVRYGEKVYSPLIPLGRADYVVSFELLESLRFLPFLSAEGKLVVNRLRIDPVPVQNGVMKYPEADLWLEKNVSGTILVATDEALKEAGNNKALNIVMLGALSSFLEFETKDWEDSIAALVKPRFVDLNIKAFELGKALTKDGKKL